MEDFTKYLQETVTSVYSIHDRYAGYQNLFLCDNDPSAIRAFFIFLSNSPLCDNYDLYRLGLFNMSTGEIDSFKERTISGAFLTVHVSRYKEDNNYSVDFEQLSKDYEISVYQNGSV